MILPFSNRIIHEDMENIYDRLKDQLDGLRNTTIMLSGASSMIAMYIIFFLCYLNEVHEYHITILAITKTQRFQREYEELCKKDYIIFDNLNLSESTSRGIHIDYIIHAAGITDPRQFSLIPVEVAKANAIDTFSILECAKENYCKGVLFFSSASIYGAFSEMPASVKESDMGVVDPIDEYSCYSESNRMGECWVKAFSTEYSVRAMIARIWYVYGPTMRVNDDSRVVSSFIRSVLDKKDIEMYSSGDDKRSFLYLADAVVGVFRILLLGEKGEAYNLCNSKEFNSVHELAENLVSLRPTFGIRVVKKQRTKEDTYATNKSNHSNQPNGDKIKSLGFEEKYTLLQGLSRTLSYLETINKGI